MRWISEISLMRCQMLPTRKELDVLGIARKFWVSRNALDVMPDEPCNLTLLE
jgi:hypothetical protein